MSEELKKRLAELGLNNVQSVTEVGGDDVSHILNLTTGAAIGLAADDPLRSGGGGTQAPEFASIIGVEDMSLARKIDAGLTRARVRHVVHDDAWYIDPAPGNSEPILRGFSEDFVDMTEHNQAKIVRHKPEEEVDEDPVVISDGRCGVVIYYQSGKVYTLELSSEEPMTNQGQTEEQASSPMISVDDVELNVSELVTADEDSWLHGLLAQHAETRTRTNILWALRAFLRYRLPKAEDKALLERFELPDAVVYARERLASEREGHENTLVTTCRTEAEELERDLRDAYNRSMEGEELTIDEWKTLCVARENLLVAMQTLSPTPRTTTLADFVDELDELGYMVLTSSNASGITFESEQLWRGVLAGDESWWLRPHRLE